MVSCRWSSRGEKNDPTGRAAEAGPAEDDLLAAGDGERPIRQGLLRVVEPSCGSVAAWAGNVLFDRRIGGRVGVDVVLQQLQGEGLGEVIGTLLALVEGDKIGIVGEHEVEGLCGLVEELLAELLA